MPDIAYGTTTLYYMNNHISDYIIVTRLLFTDPVCFTEAAVRDLVRDEVV